MTKDLHKETIELLALVPRTISLSKIAAEAKVKQSWLSAFMANKIPEPGVHKTQRLRNYLVTVVTQA